MTSPSLILLADDDPIMRELAQEKLREAGFGVVLAENGSQALEKLRCSEETIDLVISDLDMPVMNGFELTENIRADRSLAETPVIVITASDFPDAVERAFASGATSFLSKPINWTLFTQAVMFVLRASQDKKALILARDQAEAGARFKDGLLSVMSHELRTPLNAIIGFGQLLAEQFEKQQDATNKEYADFIVDGGRRLLNNISDMLLASDARSGPIKINEVDTTIGLVVDDALQYASNCVKTADAQVVLKVHDRNLEICCDKALMSRALSKLVENAVKFSNRGVKVIIGTALTKKGELAVLVKDNGPGISPEKLKEAITPFSQADMSPKRTNEGLGLGLPLAQAILSAHGASLRLQSENGDGAKAVIVVPKSRISVKTPRAARNAA